MHSYGHRNLLGQWGICDKIRNETQENLNVLWIHPKNFNSPCISGSILRYWKWMNSWKKGLRSLKESNMKSLSRARLFLTPWTVLGSSIHGIFQARILEWVTISFSRKSSWPRDQTHVSCTSCIAGGFFTIWPTREVS